VRLTVFGPGYPFRGGIARTTTELVRELGSRGHEMLFLTPVHQYPRWLYPGISDRDPEACPPLDVATAVLDPLDPLSWRRTRRCAEANRSDAWIMPYWTWAWAGLWRALLTSSRRPPAVAVVHNPADHDARIWQRLAARRVLGGCRGLFTHASSLAEQLERDYPGVPVAHHPLPAVGEGTPEDRRTARRRLGLAEDRRVALFVGLIRPYKGVDVLLEAAAGLPEGSDWLVVVAGEPWGRLGSELEQQAETLGLVDRVRLDLGWVPEDRLADLMDAADLLVLPYRRGSQSAVAPMGLARGVPVLATDVGGVPEVVKDGVNGVIVPPSDAAAITAALEGLERDRLDGLAEGARRSASMLRWPGYATAFEELLAEVV